MVVKNSKSEILNSKQIPISNVQNSKQYSENTHPIVEKAK